MEEQQEVVVAQDIDDWEQFTQESDTHEQQLSIAKGESFSSGIRKMLQRPASDDILPVKNKDQHPLFIFLAPFPILSLTSFPCDLLSSHKIIYLFSP